MTLLLDNEAVDGLLTAGDLVDVLDAAYRDLAGGEAVCAPRIDVQSRATDAGETYQLGLAVGLRVGRYAALRIKSEMTRRRLVDGRPRKETYGAEPGRTVGLVLLFDATNGALLAIIHDGLIQRMRVGADSALGIRYMARPEASRLAILGAGSTARTHLEAIAATRALDHVRVFSPTAAHREAFARDMRERHGLAVDAVATPDAAIAGADLVAGCANAIGPIIFGPQLEPGMHVTCTGGALDAEANARIDRALRLGNAPPPLELAAWERGVDCLTFAAGGGETGHGGTRRRRAEIPPERRVTLAELLAAPGRGRTRPEEITFSERGNIHGVQFTAVAGQVYERALAVGVGTEIPSAAFLQTIRN